MPITRASLKAGCIKAMSDHPEPPPMERVDCEATLIDATTTLLVNGKMMEARVCNRGHKVYSGKTVFVLIVL